MKLQFLIATLCAVVATLATAAEKTNPDAPVEKPDKVVRSKATGNILRFKTPDENTAEAAAGGKGAESAGAKKDGKGGAGGKKNVAGKKGAGKEGDAEGGAEKSSVKTEPQSKPEDDDNIETVTGELLYGKIHKELPDSVIIIMRKDQARVSVPRAKIKALNYSMQTRLNSLDKDDTAGQYKVGLWAMDKSMYPEAIKLFEILKKDTFEEGKEGAGPDLVKQLAKAYDQRGQLDKAYENYQEYAEGHSDDKEVADAIARIEPQVKPKEAAVDAPAKHADGLEADGKWQAETWANPTTVAFTTDKTGNKMVAIQSPGGTQDKMAFSRYGQPLNLSESTEMVFKAYNDGDKPVRLACAFVNAEGLFFEGHEIKIPSKAWFKGSIKIDGKTFKSKIDDFKLYNFPISGREHIARITFMVYDQREVKLFLDSIFFK